ncbi:MAG: DUF6298 domain-containing protein [Verrucomicrobiota bacterium]
MKPPTVFSCLCAAVACSVISLRAVEVPSPVKGGEGGKLTYETDPAGNRVPDFSAAGYVGGGVTLPDVTPRLLVKPGTGDAGSRIQAAIDQMATLKPDAAGLRGAVLLAPGRYEIAGQVKITASGVVLRGSGNGESGTILVATGTGRRALLEIAGNDVRRPLGEPRQVSDDVVPVGANHLKLSNTAGLKPGVTISIERPSTAEWIKFLGMDTTPGRQGYQWKAGTLDIFWDRVVTAVNGNDVQFDAPLTTALESRFGGGIVQAYVQEGYLSQCGIENLRCVSNFDAANPLDEQHAWNAIDLHGLQDGWVSDVTALHFAGSAVQVGTKVSRVTIQDCKSLEPVSELGGYRRLSFHTRGQQALFVRCISEHGRNDFTTSYMTAGPTVFLDCEASESTGFSGSLGSWSSGILFDTVKIDGGSIRLDNLETFNQGVGWAAANSMLWGSSAGTIICRTPPGARNWAVCVWSRYIGDGSWTATNTFAKPESLYRAQLADRLGPQATNALAPRKYAAAPAGLREAAPPTAPAPEPAGKPLTLEKGTLMIDGKPLSGKEANCAWWRGRLEPARTKEIGTALTRFAPGRTGTGLTDEPPAVAAEMARSNRPLIRHHYGLWYDRRRDDHQMIRRPDADVWPPFFEQPFARTGKGTAWDGLSRYDLTKYNPWYFDRLHSFALEGRKNGVVLVNEMYFQHNIIESGAHWVDCPWRTVNNINNSGFTEPPPFDGDTIKMADEFYDVKHPLRRELHKAYIRHHLDVLGAESNVIHTLSAENTGPLHFMQFWIDTIAEWEKETGKHPLIALSATKDVQDAILSDPTRAAVIDIIDLTYWYRNDKGEEFAPAGGESLAPRQQQRKLKMGAPSAASIKEMAQEYRRKFLDKAVISGLDQAADVQP